MWGKSLVDESSPNFLGIYAGAASQEPVRRAIEDAPVLVTAGVVFTDMVSGFFSQRIDPARTIDIGPDQSVIAGHVYAPLDMAAALAAITSILAGRGITSAPLPPTPAPAQGSPPPRDQPLTQESLWDRLSQALTPGNVVLADQGTSFYGMAGHRLASGVTFIGQPLWGVDRLHAARRVGRGPGRTGPPHGAADRRRRRAVDGSGAGRLRARGACAGGRCRQQRRLHRRTRDPRPADPIQRHRRLALDGPAPRVGRTRRRRARGSDAGTHGRRAARGFRRCRTSP